MDNSSGKGGRGGGGVMFISFYELSSYALSFRGLNLHGFTMCLLLTIATSYTMVPLNMLPFVLEHMQMAAPVVLI